MENFTIHVFGYGETQINSNNLSIKVSTDSLKSVTPLLGAIFTKKPIDNSTLVTEFHAVNIFGYNDIRWMSKDSFDVKDDTDLKSFIDKLIVELQKTKDKLETPKVEMVTPPAPNMDAPKS
jgi:hypothetical protein